MCSDLDMALQRAERGWAECSRACAGLQTERDALRADIAELRQERDALLEANESVAVCAKHTAEVTWSEETPCLVCALQQAEADLAALKGRTCATCRHRVDEGAGGISDTCANPQLHARRGTIFCFVFGNTCGAWAAKEADHA